jgi:hypothetical protein
MSDAIEPKKPKEAELRFAFGTGSGDIEGEIRRFRHLLQFSNTARTNHCVTFSSLVTHRSTPAEIGDASSER